MVSRTTLSRILPFAAYIFFMLLADVLINLGWTMQELRWLYAAKISAVIAVLWFYRHDYAELRLTRNLRALDWMVPVATGALVFVAWVNLNKDWMVVGVPSGFDPQDDAGNNWGLILVRLAGAALIVPVMEELFWRSFLMRWICSRDFIFVAPARVGLKAFAVTAIFFAFEHNLWLAGLLAGVTYNWLYMRSENLWSPLISHAVTNGLLGIWVIYTGNWRYW